MQFSELSQKIS